MIAETDRLLIEYLIGDGAFTEGALVEEFLYISNPDGTMRWVYPEHLKEPYFLNFYSTSSLRAKVLSSIIKLAFFTKQSHRVKSGDLKLNISKNSRLGKVLHEYPHTGFSIFTGTVGENRKAVIEIHDKKKLFVFVKIALTEVAKILVNNEAICLKHLNTFEFSSLIIPKLLSSNNQDTIGLSNIKPKHFQQKSSITDVHVQALSELYKKSSRRVKWADLETLHASKNRAKNLLDDFEIINDLEKSRVQELANKVLKLINMLEEKEDEITVAISHGDFTPWNMYSSNNVLHLFDWELSENNTPLMFDLFHFIFQSEVMIKQSNYIKVNEELRKVFNTKNVKSIISEYSLDFDKHYIFYLIYIIPYYSKKYIEQEYLHVQAIWLFNIWEEAVDDILKRKGNIFND